MGLCSSCGKSKDRFKDKSSKICGQLHSVVTPLHVAHEPTSSNNLNGHLPGHNHVDNPTRPNSTTSTTTMATSFPNMNLTNPIRGLVSKRRNRYKQDGFNLDLTYITQNIIAMGYPASNIEGVYRNHIDDVVKLLDSKHNNHYFIYNLCSERNYDKSKFHNRVQSFPFDDHNPPKIELIQPFCKNVHEWLTMHPENVAVVHCKAGKGRTGTMICCYLLHSGVFCTADEALNHYGQARTQDRKGVTIPSQVRYIKYYEIMLRERLEYVPVSMYIKEIILQPVPIFAGGQGYVCFSISQQTLHQQGEQHTQKCTKLYKSGVYEVKKGVSNLVINLDLCLVLNGDIKVEFYNKSKIGRKERVFQFWFNTFFVVNQTDNANGFIEQNGSGLDQTYVMTLKKDELDIVNKKDKQNKVFSADFQLTLLLEKIPKNQSSWSNYSQEIPRLPQDTPSESSEAEWSEIDSAEEGWESDNIYKARNMILGLDDTPITADIPRSYHLPNTAAQPSSPFSPNHDMLNTPTNLNPTPMSPLMSPMFSWQFPSSQTAPFVGMPQKPQFMFNVMQQSSNSSGFQSYDQPRGDQSMLSSISSNSSNFLPSPRSSLSPQHEPPTTSDYQSMNEKKASSYEGYDSKRLAGLKAMQNRPNPSVYRVPTNTWSGYGISHTSPAGFLMKKDEDMWKSPSSSEQYPSTSGMNMNTSNILDHTPTHLLNRITNSNWSDLPSLLSSLGLDRYVSLFVQHEVDLATFATLSDKDLMTIGVSAFGSRRKMLLAISELNKRSCTFSMAPGAERKSSSSNSSSSHDNSPREIW